MWSIILVGPVIKITYDNTQVMMSSFLEISYILLYFFCYIKMAFYDTKGALPSATQYELWSVSWSTHESVNSYFSDRTQRVQIDGILSEFAEIVCGVPQGSVLGPLKFCLYMLPLSAILRFHNIGYHVYADDTQIYVSFKCEDPLQALGKINLCISDIRRWMILNKLKINDAKTEFIIFRSTQMKHDLNSLSVNVSDSQIVPSVKVRSL